MKGRIIKFFEDKGYGFLIDENGEQRFFHVKSVKSPLDICVRAEVEFSPLETPKGMSAVDIVVLVKNEKSRYVKIGDIRLARSNIKKYSVSDEYYYQVIDKNFKSEGAKAFSVIGEVAKVLLSSGDYDSESSLLKEKKPILSLHVRTYQGDDYVWTESEIDIDKVLEDLDS